MQQLQSRYRWFQTFRRLRINVILAIALLVFAFTSATIFLPAQTPQNVHAQTVPALVKTSESPHQAEVAQPVATSPATPKNATPQPAPAPALAPTPAPAYDKVSIASIGLSSRFVAVGLTSTNAIDVNPSLVGWWDGSAQPGNPGAVFLDGHNPGVFRALPSVQVGAQISLTKASGEIFNYTVVHTEIVQLVDANIDMNTALSPYAGASEGLNLMTCVGTYNRQTGSTDQRFVVYAVRS